MTAHVLFRDRFLWIEIPMHCATASHCTACCFKRKHYDSLL